MDKFDERLKLWGPHVPGDMHQALVDVNDTLDMCLTMAETRFKYKKFTPADVIELVRLTLEQERSIVARREAAEKVRD